MSAMRGIHAENDQKPQSYTPYMESSSRINAAQQSCLVEEFVYINTLAPNRGRATLVVPE